MKTFSAYIALGDSMSIDLYPALDMGQPPDTPLGAAALLHTNLTKFWPQFDGRDLVTFNPEIAFVNLTEDGATTWDLLDGAYLKYIDQYAEQRVFITITLGGNDALQMLAIEAGQGAKLTTEVANITDRYKKVLSQICNKFRRATLMLNTIYDPSDGTGLMPGYPGFADKLPFLRYINDQIRLSARASNSLLADVHNHFLGHGTSSTPIECWYWKTNPIEPSALGASELRALWLQSLEAAGLIK
jgi:lysophospholipase L1-like esterase